jgi:hypothetical protein
MGFNEATRHKIIDTVLRGTSLFVAGDAVSHISLHTADPGETGASEVAGGSYARQAITWTAPVAGESENDADLEWANFPDITPDQVTHVGLWDDVAAGNFRGGGAFTSPLDPGAGDTVRVAAGALTMELT